MEKTEFRLSRRHLLRTTFAAATLRALPLSAAGSGQRALVCIYLFGGNDSNNMVVPLSSYDSYAAIRGSLAIPKPELIPVTSGMDQAQYGLHPALGEVAQLFHAGTLAVMSNVGSAAAPTFTDPYLSYFPSAYATPSWAAQLAEVTEQDRKSLFVDFPNLHAAPNATTAMSLVAPGVSATKQMREKVAEAAQRGGDWRIAFPDTGLGQQLRQAATLIRTGGSLGMDRQVFLVSLSGFETRSNQLPTQAALFRELSSAMAAFHAATNEMGMSQSVTTYTDTEFSRTLRPTRSGGSEPAWGGHQLVMGGAVLGGSVYGTFPAPIAGGQHDPRQLGILRPQNTKDQYHATLATWFGVPSSQISTYLPGVRNLGRPTLGFMVTG